MPRYLQLGDIPRKRHTEFRVDGHRLPGGYLGEGIYYEEVITTEGFHRAYSIAYHLRPPTRIVRIEGVDEKPAYGVDSNDAHQIPRPVHLKTAAMPRASDVIYGRMGLFENADVRVSRCRPMQQQSALYRNAADDELIFVRRGTGRLLSMFGQLPFRDLDYLVIPSFGRMQLLAPPLPMQARRLHRFVLVWRYWII